MYLIQYWPLKRRRFSVNCGIRQLYVFSAPAPEFVVHVSRLDLDLQVENSGTSLTCQAQKVLTSGIGGGGWGR
jgi:hypothetical protein